VVHAAYDKQSNHEVRLGIVRTEEDALSSHLSIQVSIGEKFLVHSFTQPALQSRYCHKLPSTISILHTFVLQVMNSLY
jgi:hypothetical protein